jgi:hypothetical protein
MSVTHAVGHPHPHPGTEPDGEAVAPAHPSPYPVYYVPQPNRFTRFFLRLHERSPRWAAPAAIAACFAGTAAGVVALNPAAAGADYVSTCVIKMTTGLDCPGCGGTRAFYYLLQGNVPDAARHHVLAVFAVPFLLWLYVAWSVRTIWGKQIPYPKITTKVIGIYLAAWFVFMVVRNLPFAPFTALYV